MKLHGIDISVKNKPMLDLTFIPIYKFNQAFLKTAKKPIVLAFERADGQMAVVRTFIHGTSDMKSADNYYVNRLSKTMLWMKGGFRIYVSGDEEIYNYLLDSYSEGGAQEFDCEFMANVFEHPFEVVYTEKIPEVKDSPKHMGAHLEGCRIGFDAGGSDRKVSAVINGESVYSEEVIWHPKVNSDPDYHYNGIVAALKSAASHLPKVDAVGISSAGIYINNRTMTASLFIKVPKTLYDAKVKDIFIRAVADTFGNVPFEVVNDGDVSALAGMMSLETPNVLGIAMGTSEAAGFVDFEGRITGWLNELAFVPVDCQSNALRDEWSLDIGCGVKYFSQDSVIKLAPFAGLELDAGLSPAEKLEIVQKKMKANDSAAVNIYLTIGSYLGHTLAYYHDLYNCEHVLLLGRVMSDKGGDIIIEEADRVLKDEYPDVSAKLSLHLPDEKFRRVGQSVAAASLPEIR